MPQIFLGGDAAFSATSLMFVLGAGTGHTGPFLPFQGGYGAAGGLWALIRAAKTSRKRINPSQRFCIPIPQQVKPVEVRKLTPASCLSPWKFNVRVGISWRMVTVVSTEWR